MPTLTSLAEELLTQAKELDAMLEQNNIPPTSFDEDTLALLPLEAQGLRKDLMNASHDFKQLLRGASLSGLDISFNWIEQVILRIIWKFKLASAIPLNGSATYEEISAVSGLSITIVIRAIRGAIGLNIFDVEAEAGRIRHTAISKLLATDEDYYNAIGLHIWDLGPPSAKLISAWEAFGGDAGEPDQSAFSLYYGGRSLFTVLTEEPERAHRFDSAMKFYTKDRLLGMDDIGSAFDWSILDKPGSSQSRLIDLGGGYGQMAQLLAKRTTHLVFIVQDLAHVVEQGEKLLPQEFKERISFEAHNFLDPQPERSCTQDVFLISRCLHNWSDYHSARILRGLIPALRKGSKVLIWDSVLDERPPKMLSDRWNVQQDFIMATNSNGRDRTLEEFRRVLELSDARFEIKGLYKPAGSQLGLIELSWSG